MQESILKTKSFKTVLIMVLLTFLIHQNLIIVLASDSPETVIETGDAEVNLGAINEANQNTLDDVPAIPPIEDQDELDPQKEASSTDETIGTSTDETEGEVYDEETATGSPYTLIDNENEAETENLLSGMAETGENSVSSTSGALIDTGDADLNAITGNDINSNSSDGSLATTTATSGPAAVIKNDNKATTTNELDLDADTGNNEISSTTGDAFISTGDIHIISAIINYINTNFFGKGKQFFVNIFDQFSGNVDLSGHGEEGDAGAPAPYCEGENCHISIENENTSNTDNIINIDANTGVNLIDNVEGNSIIETGDINILNDIVNINNLNISGDDWYFAIVNIFGVLDGDIILPGWFENESEAAEFVDMAEKNAFETKEVIVANKNNADQLNNIDINAETGENLIASSSESSINTGDAIIEMTAFNLINYNYTGDYWRFAKVNIFGNWKGIIENLPPGYGYFRDDNGVTIYNEHFDPDAFINSFAKLMVENNNNAETTNTIAIDANTGNNQILDGEGEINTGDIYVKNNLLNFINSNFTGQNWEFSMINVFGEWQGNLAFGQPDLWITQTIDTLGQNELSRGDLATYTILFGNKGDASASDVKLIYNFDHNIFEIDSNSGLLSDGRLTIDIGNLPPNSQGSISYSVKVKNDISYGSREVENSTRISSLEKDRDYSDNIARSSILVNGGVQTSGAISAVSIGSSRLPGLSIIKTNNAPAELKPGDTVSYEIIIENTGWVELEDVLVSDVMTHMDSGEEIMSDIWDLETVYGGERIFIEYAIEINESFKSGTYINEAIVEGYDEIGNRYINAFSSSKIKTVNQEQRDQKMPQLIIGGVNRNNKIYPGSEADLNLIITNNGQGTAENISLRINLPAGLTFADNNESEIFYDYSEIRSGEIINIDKKVKITNEADPGVYSSSIYSRGDNVSDQEFVYEMELMKKEMINDADNYGGLIISESKDSQKRYSYNNQYEADNMPFLDNENSENGEVAGIETIINESEKLALGDSDPKSAYAAGNSRSILGSFNRGDMVLMGVILLIVASFILGLKKFKYNN